MKSQSNRSLLRYLRIGSAVACFAFFGLTIVLWIRSYHRLDGAKLCYASGQFITKGVQQLPTYRYISANTSLGIVSFLVNPAHFNPIDPAHERTGVDYFSMEVRDDWWWKRDNTFGFAYKSRPQGAMTIAIPFWFLTLLTAAVGTMLWMQRPYRFTLRGALVATTFIAVVLGMGVALSR